MIDVRKVILPTRYTQPSKNDVVKYLQTKAGELSGALVLPRGVTPKNEGKLETMLRKLPEQMRQDIRTGNPNCEEFMREHTSAQTASGAQYFHVLYGELPAKLIEANRKAGTVKSPEWYKAAMSDEDLLKEDFGIQWIARIKLEKGMLPAKEAIDVLIKHGTYGSQTMVVSDQKYDIDDVQAVIDAIYLGIETNYALAQLPDVSDKVIEEHASEPVGALLQMTMLRQAKEQAMMQMLAQQQGKSGPNFMAMQQFLKQYGKE